MFGTQKRETRKTRDVMPLCEVWECGGGVGGAGRLGCGGVALGRRRQFGGGDIGGGGEGGIAFLVKAK